jgi:hypothetical protein
LIFRAEGFVDLLRQAFYALLIGTSPILLLTLLFDGEAAGGSVAAWAEVVVALGLWLAAAVVFAFLFAAGAAVRAALGYEADEPLR